MTRLQQETKRCRRPSLLAGSLLALVLAVPPVRGQEKPPPGVKMFLPRNSIAAIDAPLFVPAAAAEIPADAWVLGVVIDGEARAYSLNLLNRHEIVNDRVGQRDIAAVW